MKPIPLLIIGFTLFLASCKKDYDSDLRGRWQLRTEFPNNGLSHTIDSIFYSFDNRVVSVQNVESSLYTKLVFGKYTQTNDSLFFDYVDWDENHDYLQKKKIIFFKSEHYLVVKLNSYTLHLKSKERELIFRKF